MIRRYCDCCGKEMDEENTPKLGMNNNRLQAKIVGTDTITELSVEVITSKDGVSNAGDFCTYCVLDAIASLDDRIQLPEIVYTTPTAFPQSSLVWKIGSNPT